MARLPRKIIVKLTQPIGKAGTYIFSQLLTAGSVSFFVNQATPLKPAGWVSLSSFWFLIGLSVVHSIYVALFYRNEKEIDDDLSAVRKLTKAKQSERLYEAAADRLVSIMGETSNSKEVCETLKLWEEI